MNLSKLISTNPNIGLIKEFSAFLLLFPTLVAGLHQFGILVSIDVDLITFFSVSSLAKDGIIFTFECVILFVLSYVYRLIITKFIYKKYKKYLECVSVFSTILGLSLLTLTKYFLLENYAYVVLFLAAFFYLNHAVFIKKDIFSTLGIYVGQTFIILVINSTLAQFPMHGIRNFDQITEKVKVKYDKSRLLYYNDEYLFFSLKEFRPKDMKKDVLVIKMEEIFNNDFQVN